MTQRNWIPGPPQGEIEPDRLYAVLMQSTAGYSVGIVIRGEDCNWQKTTIGHMPLPVTMNSAEARRLQRMGWYEIPKTTREPENPAAGFLNEFADLIEKYAPHCPDIYYTSSDNGTNISIQGKNVFADFLTIYDNFEKTPWDKLRAAAAKVLKEAADGK